MRENNLSENIRKKNWALIKEAISPEEITKILDYARSMDLAYDLFFENLGDEEFQNFALELFFLIKGKFFINWDADWKNDAFLGQLCGLSWRYDERYACYKRAFDKLEDPPDSLLLLLSSCNSQPGKPAISDDESEAYLKRALEKKITFEAAVQMRGLARSNKDLRQAEYWDKKCSELKNQNIHTDTIVPDVLEHKSRLE